MWLGMSKGPEYRSGAASSRTATTTMVLFMTEQWDALLKTE